MLKRRMLGILFLVSLLFILISTAIITHATDFNTNTKWLLDGKYGIMTHFAKGFSNIDLNDPDGANWNATVNGFNVTTYVNNVKESGAKWVILTMGQGTGFYIAPNTYFDNKLIAAGYAARSPSRDLVMEIADALSANGIKLIIYFVGDASWNDTPGRLALTENGDYEMNATFKQNVINIAQEWSQRYGSKVAGWWIDGIYAEDFTPPEQRYTLVERNSYAAALKSGNANAIIAYNNYSQVVPVRAGYDCEDYTAGELPFIGPCPTSGRWLDGSQWHGLTYLGNDWCGSGSRYTSQEIIDWVDNVYAMQGACTLDIQIFADGSLNVDQLYILKDLKIDREGGCAESVKIDDRYSGVKYSGTWGNVSGSSYYDSTGKYSTAANSYAQFSFSGKYIKLYGVIGSDHGKADVYIDNTFDKTIDCYESGWAANCLVYSKTGLTDANHNIKIVVRDDKNALSSDYYVEIDAFVFTPTPQYYTIKDRWKGKFMYDSGDGYIRYGSYVDSDNYRWALETGTGAVKIRNKATNRYLSTENQLGHLQSLIAFPNSQWTSIRWTFEDTDSGYKRIKNNWVLTPYYLHVENQLGYVQYGDVPPTYLSAQFLFTADPLSDIILYDK